MKRIQNPSLKWDEAGNPASTGFDDVYYNRKNGLEETRLTFLEANNLPQAWVNQANFTIAETGFGTGLNFLATWQLFEETTTTERLDFISFEQFPLHKDDLTRALANWRPLLGDMLINRLIKIYPPRIPGFHRLWITDRLTLTLIFDDALRSLKQLECPIDAWFLDGFAPKKNEAMWQPEIYVEMARLSHSKTTLGSFTAVGNVKRGLKEAGFTIQRLKGYGYKYHRIIGSFENGAVKPVIQKPDHVTVVGAGLAGSAAAFALNRRGIKTTIIDQNPQAGMNASGNMLGLINPKIEVQDNPRNDIGLAAFSFANHILGDLNGIDYQQNGALHLFSKDKKTKKLLKIVQQGDWLEPHLQERENGLFFADSATVNTAKLVDTLSKNSIVTFNKKIDAIDGTTIFAGGLGLRDFLPELPVQAVRGQVTYIASDVKIDQPLMYGHYIAPVSKNVFALGASFEQNNDQAVIKDSDDEENIAAARDIVDLGDVKITDHWANVRTASRDRFPIVGQHPVHKNLYISGALGSHGIQFSLLHGEILACLLTGAPLPVGKDALKSLSITRFY